MVTITAIARPVVHAAETVLEVAAITAASVLGLAAVGGIAYVALRARSVRVRRIPPQGAALIELAERITPRAIEAPRRSLADLRSLAAGHGYDVVVGQEPQD